MERLSFVEHHSLFGDGLALLIERRAGSLTEARAH